MSKYLSIRRLIVIIMLSGLLLAACTSVPEDESEEANEAPAPATEENVAEEEMEEDQEPEATMEESETETTSPIDQFPTDVQPLLQDVSPELVELLWQVRQQGPDDLIWVDFGGELHEAARRAYLEDWEQITGWTVVQTSPGTGPALANLQAQVESGNPEWDVFAILNYGSASSLAAEGNFAAMDLSLFPIDQFPESSRYDPQGYWVNWTDFGIVLTWNTEAFPEDRQPESALDIFDLETYPGKRCLFNFVQSSGNLELALLDDGVPFDEVYETLSTDEGVQRALDKLETIYDETVFVSSGADSIQFPLDGQCDMSITFSGRPALRLLDEPTLPLDMTWDDGLISGGPIAVVEGTSHFEAAQSVVAFALQPANNCTFLNETAYGVIMTGPLFPDCMTDFAQRFGPNLEIISGVQNGEFYFEEGERLNEAWTAWQTAAR